MLSVSGPCDESRIPLAARALENLGLRCYVMESCYKRADYLAGDDRSRAADLHQAFSDPAFKGIFAARGGYGAQRILPLLDLRLLRQNPKVFAGYSDVTALHTVLNQSCGLITFHAPMPVSDLYENPDAFTLRVLTKALFRPQRAGGRPRHIKNPMSKPLTSLAPGRAKGRLAGGNLTMLVSSLGTAYEIDTRGKILFIEEINEEPYKIDRMLLQLKLAGKFADCAGIVLGRLDPAGLSDIKMAIHDLLLPEGKPVLGGLACGHGLPSQTLPLGAYAYLDADIRQSGIFYVTP